MKMIDGEDVFERNKIELEIVLKCKIILEVLMGLKIIWIENYFFDYFKRMFS